MLKRGGFSWEIGNEGISSLRFFQRVCKTDPEPLDYITPGVVDRADVV